MRYCCSNCFGDFQLASEISEISELEGDCSYCKTSSVSLVDPVRLRENFELLSGVYVEKSDGLTLGEWFKKDWLLFPGLDLANVKDLLSDIFDDGNVPRVLYGPSERCSSQNLDSWERLRRELIEENRFFPANNFSYERINYLLSQLIYREELPDSWFRARIQEAEDVFPIDQMGPPPKGKATHGRANPVGIPYLYVASEPLTAISEIRPHTGEFVSVAEFKIQGEVKLADLRDPRRMISPFMCGDVDLIAELRGDVDFLERLGFELTRPVFPRSAAIDYVPSQYLCELIKKNGFDGVVYKSSLGAAVNLALFYPAKAKGVSVSSHTVKSVLVDAPAR